MMRSSLRPCPSLLVCSLMFSFSLCISCFAEFAEAESNPKFEKLKKEQANGNYKEAATGYIELLERESSNQREQREILTKAVESLVQFGAPELAEKTIEDVVKLHSKNWHLLIGAAKDLRSLESYGTIVAGKFTRGPLRGGRAKYASALKRDRVRALQLLMSASQLLASGSVVEPTAREREELWLEIAANLIRDVQGWELQALTALDKLSEYDELPEGYWGGVTERTGAPVTADGQPVYHSVPESFEAAKSDGERFRYALRKAAEIDELAKAKSTIAFAHFLRSQFGTETVGEPQIYGRGRVQEDEDSTDGDGVKKSGAYALRTLTDSETIARLAVGIKRFTLPDEFNYIRMLSVLADSEDPTVATEKQTALETLGGIFDSREQYTRSVEYWKRADDSTRVREIVGAWGGLQTTKAAAAGTTPELSYLFRNGSSVELEAFEIDTETLIADAISYLKANPKEFDYSKVQIEDLGYQLLNGDQKKYVGKRVASWKHSLSPFPGHYDRLTKIEVPLENPGTYLISARIAGGNRSHIVLPITRAVILSKALKGGGKLYFVADAKTGKPIVDTKLKFFGYKTDYVNYDRYMPGLRQVNVRTAEFSKDTDKTGAAVTAGSEQENGFQWLVTAELGGKPIANLGFDSWWSSSFHDSRYDQTKSYVITDRPVYRPGQSVKFKAWVARAAYERDGSSDFAEKQILVSITNPKSEKLFEKQLAADSFGGVNSELELPKDAQLGVYYIRIGSYGSGSFRVEEYKKPEFKVEVDAPSDPVMLGDEIRAEVKATYYHGAPVTKGKVTVKVERFEHSSRWYPAAPWDWLYGRGYWWSAYDYDWFPGFFSWGCFRPYPFWFPQQRSQPELILRSEQEIGADGKATVRIDTTRAKEQQGNKDHKYKISVEVVDESRRMVAGSGEVIATRKPFEVYAWVDKGFYEPGEVVKAQFTARTAGGKAVQGTGEAKLMRISYSKEMEPSEVEVSRWALNPDSEGEAQQQLTAASLGQYRLLYTVVDPKGRRSEGAYVFSVTGDSSNPQSFRFDDIEIVPEKREYQQGEKAKLRINTEQENSTVLLFVRPENGFYPKPEIVQLHGKSFDRELTIGLPDMPNFFVEAVTIKDAKIYSEIREIYVPPVKKVLNVELTPSSMIYKPGQEASFKARVTDATGKPFSGSMVIAAYDSALEYISGGSNVAEIREFFWKWRRAHSLAQGSNIENIHQPLTASTDEGMRPIGRFSPVLSEMSFGRGRTQAVSRKADASLDGAAEMMVAAPASMAMEQGNVARMEETNLADSKQRQDSDGGKEGGEAGAEPPTKLVEPTIRKDFADAAYWNAAITTDKEGVAEVRFKMPENLTEWKVRSWVLGKGTQVGEGTVNVTTTKNLLVRLQAPRFFVERDEVVLSGNIHNYLKEAKTVSAKLELPGSVIQAIDGAEKNVTVPAGGETRVDWRVRVIREGEAIVRMAALTDEESDAVEMKFPVYVHGILKTDSYSGALRPEQSEGSLEFTVPAERRVEQSDVVVRYSPSLAVAMVDALPYLVNYPYGCTEQTLSRFLPTAIVQKVLLEMKLDLNSIKEKRTNLNAQELGEAEIRSKQWKRYQETPVFDEAEVNKMSRAGLERLTQMQLSDGGWGWFSGDRENASAHTTAYVVHGLQVARAAGLSVESSIISRGISWLEHHQAAEIQKLKNAPTSTHPYKSKADDLDAFVFMVLADEGKSESEMKEFIYRDRNGLSVYSKAAFGLALFKLEDREKLSMILRNIEQFVVTDEENQTSYLKLGNEGYWWYWYGSEYEAHAYYLKLLAKTNAQSSVASGLVKYLLNNRKNSTYWSSTRDTAVVLEAFADYLKATGENKPDLVVEVLVDGHPLKSVTINSENLFTFDGTVVLHGAEISSGKHTLTIKKSGKGALYYNAYVTNFTLEDNIKRAGLEVKVNRKFYKLVRENRDILASGAHGQALTQVSEKLVRVDLAEGETLKSGELVEVELEIDSKNDYEYLIFEDFKAAGFEPLEVRSGYNGNDMNAYVEFRDERVAFFVQNLPRGKRSVSYRLRAEIPGRFSALPARGYAMYAPEIKANSDESKLGVVD